LVLKDQLRKKMQSATEDSSGEEQEEEGLNENGNEGREAGLLSFDVVDISTELDEEPELPKKGLFGMKFMQRVRFCLSCQLTDLQKMESDKVAVEEASETHELTHADMLKQGSQSNLDDGPAAPSKNLIPSHGLLEKAGISAGHK
jgi:hypothetical protein